LDNTRAFTGLFCQPIAWYSSQNREWRGISKALKITFIFVPSPNFCSKPTCTMRQKPLSDNSIQLNAALKVANIIT
jgi:hypothetical protein